MRLIDADKLEIIVGAHCLNENITLEDALLFKHIIKTSPTVESYDVSFHVNGLGNLKFHHVPSMMKEKTKDDE